MTSDYAWWERHGPRLPSHGIKAQTRRGAFGKTWWASRWIAALERLVNPGRLARGSDLRAQPGRWCRWTSAARASRRWSRAAGPSRIRCTIRFQRLSDAEWERVIDAMAAEALYAARLLSGEMPEQIEEVFANSSVSLFPATGRLQVSRADQERVVGGFLLGELLSENKHVPLPTHSVRRSRVHDCWPGPRRRQYRSLDRALTCARRCS